MDGATSDGISSPRTLIEEPSAWGLFPAYRGRGLGLRLLNATLEAAFGAGFVRVELNVHADNARAIALYDKVGFAREGTQRDAVFVDGEYRDTIAMALIRRAKVSHQ